MKVVRLRLTSRKGNQLAFKIPGKMQFFRTRCSKVRKRGKNEKRKADHKRQAGHLSLDAKIPSSPKECLPKRNVNYLNKKTGEIELSPIEPGEFGIESI